MTLVNGPLDGTDLFDRGLVLVRMGIQRGDEVGEALYEPDDSRERAFWLQNNWLGILEDRIKLE